MSTDDPTHRAQTTQAAARPGDGPHSEDRGRRHRGGRRRGRDVTRVAADLLTVRRAFGEPVREGGTTLVPVAKVMGGSGSGWGSGELGGPAARSTTGGQGQGSGGGGGFGVRVKPLGVYVVDGHQVSWRPALDLNRAILGGQVVGMIALTALAWALRRRRR